MNILVKKLTDETLMQRACQFTLHSQKETSIDLDTMYKAGHSPIRTQMFWVEMVDIPTFVSVHLVRHSIGVTHFVQSHRDDRGADFVADRDTPISHAMLISAEALINMAHKRLCLQSHELTRRVFIYIKNSLAKVDPDLAKQLVAECVYRRGACYNLGDCDIREV